MENISLYLSFSQIILEINHTYIGTQILTAKWKQDPTASKVDTRLQLVAVKKAPLTTTEASFQDVAIEDDS